jgi:hypothetical protein
MLPLSTGPVPLSGSASPLLPLLPPLPLPLLPVLPLLPPLLLPLLVLLLVLPLPLLPLPDDPLPLELESSPALPESSGPVAPPPLELPQAPDDKDRASAASRGAPQASPERPFVVKTFRDIHMGTE